MTMMQNCEIKLLENDFAFRRLGASLIAKEVSIKGDNNKRLICGLFSPNKTILTHKKTSHRLTMTGSI